MRPFGKMLTAAAVAAAFLAGVSGAAWAQGEWVAPAAEKAKKNPEKGVGNAKKSAETNCSSCHGADGGGGFGPTLAGVVVKRYPDIADQIALVTNGSGSMPSFRDSLTPAQIAAVVAYTRTKLP